MGELRYCLNMVTRQEWLTSTNAFHSSNLPIFLSFSHVFTVVELRSFDKPSLVRAGKGFPLKMPVSFSIHGLSMVAR